MKKHNFSAGPAILPESVKRKASESAWEYEGIGLSLMEISHRSKEFIRVMEQTEAHVRHLFGIHEEYAVLFLTGGASTQFFMTAMNLANKTDKIGYLDTGTWSSKAIKEARLFGDVKVLASSADRNYSYIPKNFTIPSDLKYLHLTSNNTIYGTQIRSWPDSPVPFVCDMSSDIFSRPIPMEQFDLIYAGAQKNVGPAGVTLVIIKKDILGHVEREMPTMLDYRTHIRKQSSYNTPPVFPIYVTMLTLNWIIEQGGVENMEKRNREKAELLYDAIDNNALFKGMVEKEDRSHMNATFVLEKEGLDEDFLNLCKEAGIEGIKGHRSVGGFRASMYNALEKESVQLLVSVMNEMEKKFG